MATEKWKVLSNILGGKQMFIVGRLIDTSQPLHGGNVEYAPDSHYTTDKEKAEKQAEAMNKEQ